MTLASGLLFFYFAVPMLLVPSTDQYDKLRRSSTLQFLLGFPVSPMGPRIQSLLFPLILLYIFPSISL